MKGLKFSAIVLAIFLSASMLHAAEIWTVKDSNAVEGVFKSGLFDWNPLTVTFFPGERRVRLSLSSVKNTDTISIKVFRNDEEYLNIEEPFRASSSESRSIGILDGTEYYPQLLIVFSSDESQNQYRIEISGKKGGKENEIKSFLLKKGSTEFILKLDEVLSAINGGAAYRIGDRGPAGGYVFYDKGNYDEGWRYMEVTPYDVRCSYDMHTVTCDIGFISEDGELDYYSFRDAYVFGHADNWLTTPECNDSSGKKNTKKLMEFFQGGFVLTGHPRLPAFKAEFAHGFGAYLCDKLVYNGYDDWFLPSITELEYIYSNLYKEGIGDFSRYPDYAYMSSNSYEDGEVRAIFFITGYSSIAKTINQIKSGANWGQLFHVRAVRQF